jgi:hypothetical protein
MSEQEERIAKELDQRAFSIPRDPERTTDAARVMRNS